MIEWENYMGFRIPWTEIYVCLLGFKINFTNGEKLLELRLLRYIYWGDHSDDWSGW